MRVFWGDFFFFCLNFVSFFFFFGGTGVWIQGLTLSRQAFHQLFLFLGVGIYVTLTGRWHTKKEGDWWGLQSPSAIFCAFHIQFLFFLFSVLWFWTQGLPLLGRCSTTWALTLFFFFFALDIFEIGSGYLPRWALNLKPPDLSPA
jgi:hypothetical protein